MDFQSAMETFAEAWVAANAGQQSQALALTRAANAAAAVVAANVKSPTGSLTDIAVKKEHSMSPANNSNNNAQSSSTGGEDTPTHHRRTSLQGVQDKLTQLQMQHNQQQHQQQQLHHSNDGAQSPRYATGLNSNAGNSIGGIGGRRSIDDTSPIPNTDNERSLNTAATSQNLSLTATPKLNERDERNNVGSITCLPPAALNAVSGAMSNLVAQQQCHNEKLLATTGGLENRRDFDMSKVNSKSIPLHCVVESVHSLQASLNIDTRNPWKRRPETDSYVIVAATTPWSEIVQTALQRLGYSQETSNTARGSLVIKNWKPIPLEQISDNPTIPVCDIIGEMTSVVTLRIVILRTKTSPFGEIKDKLLKLLVLQSHGVLRSTGCPLDESILSQLCRISYQNAFAFPDISEDLRRKFDQWWSNQLSPQATMTPKMLPFMAVPQPVSNDMDFPVGTAAVAAAAAAAAAAQAGLHAATGNANVPGMTVGSGMSASRDSLLLNEHNAAAVAGSTAPHHPGMLVHPAMHASMHHHHHHAHSQYPNQKTRMRTSFDPEMELPKLQKWFQENPHPSRQQIQTYVVQLNALESRRGRKPLDVNNVVYWFKNARAAQKRAEMRGGLGAIGALGHAAMNGYLGQHGQLSQNSGSSAGSISGSQQLGSVNMSLTHDYLKSPLSLKSEDIDTMSQHSDDLDEEQSRPCSPQLPLSLTTHERNRNSPTEHDEHCADSRRASSSRDEHDAHDLINGSAHQRERSCSRDYNDEVAEKREKDMDENADTKHDATAEQSVTQHNEHETNNNSSNSNNNNNSNQSIEPAVQSHIDATSPKRISPKEEDEYLDMDDDDEDHENDTSQLDDFRSPSPDMASAMAQRKDLQFPMVPNSMFSQSFMYMSHYMPGFGQAAAGHPHAHHAVAAAAGMQQNPLMGPGGLNLSSLSNEERRKRNRTFIDPVTEVPKLEQWFAMNTHPSHNLILKYTEDLNTMPYRQKFPRLESKNVQFWFKNRRAKCKRLKMSLYDNSQFSGLNSFVHKYEERD